MKRKFLALNLIVSITVILAMYAVHAQMGQQINIYQDGRIMSGESPLQIPPLLEIIDGAVDDEDAGDEIRQYYEDNADFIAAEFRESNELRARALYGMYIVHMAAPYNVTPVVPNTLIEFANTPTAHCGTYALAQSQVYDALGIEWRNVLIDGGWHGLIEANIDGNWEIFDSTINIWVNVSALDLIHGSSRVYRQFYTPALDPNASPVYRQHIIESGGYFNAVELRGGIPLWGITVMVRQYEIYRSSE